MSNGWRNIEKNPTWRGLQRVRQLATLVVTGKKAMQMFCSLPGLGKTETVLEVFKEHNLPPHYCSPRSAGTFCTDLWMHRDRTYFLDDCDILARSEPCANIGKMAWGPQRLVVVPTTREIQRNEQRRLDDDDKYNPNIPPPTFHVGPKHGVIWNSNKNFADPATVAKELAADFAALVSRGLDPLWVPGEPQSVFDHTVWMILDGMLRRHPQGDFRNDRGGFKLAIQQEVLDFICTHGRRLKEISPRMAYKLAAARRDDPAWEEAWKEQLAPKALWNGLILPDEAPSLLSPAMKRELAPPPKPEPEPPSTPERVPEPANDPTPEPPEPPPAASQPQQTVIEPEPSESSQVGVQHPAPPVDEPPDRRAVLAAINAVYALPTPTTGQMVAGVLARVPLSEWDEDDLSALAEGLGNRAEWNGEHESLAYCYVELDRSGSFKLFPDAEGILQYDVEHGLRIVTWEEAEKRIAPALAEARRKRDEEQRRRQVLDTYHKKLPKVRKLKPMKEMIDQIRGLGAKITEEGERAIEYVLTMQKDDPQFAPCKTFKEYIVKANEIAKSVKPEPHSPMD